MAINFTQILFLALAASCGALSRFGLGLVFSQVFKQSFWSVFIINIIGCFCFGIVYQLAENIGQAQTGYLKEYLIDKNLTKILLVGFVGSFTTFSSLIFDLNNLINHKAFFLLALNLFGQIIFGLFALRLAIFLIKN